MSNVLTFVKQIPNAVFFPPQFGKAPHNVAYGYCDCGQFHTLATSVALVDEDKRTEYLAWIHRTQRFL